MRNLILLLFLVALATVVVATTRKKHVGPTTTRVKPSPSPNKDASPTPSGSPVAASAANPQPSSSAAKLDSLIDVSIHTSRLQVTAGSGFGIAADIRNKSTQPVYLRPKYLIMSLPSEIDPDPPSMWWGLIPPQQSQTSDFEQIIYLAPGATTSVFWAGNPQNTKRHWWGTIWDLMAFPPGEYTIRVVGNYWTDFDSADKQAKNYGTQTAEFKVAIAAPQWVILVGAIIGGLIAYFLLPKARLHPERIDLSGLLTAMLLSSIVTILLARLSETQFLIRVTIADLWGAIAIGFVAGASGTAILQKYVSHPDPHAPTTTTKLRNWVQKRRQAKGSAKKTELGADEATEHETI